MAEAVGGEIFKILLEKFVSGALNKAQFLLETDSHVEDLEQTNHMLTALLLDVDETNLSSVKRKMLKQLSSVVNRMCDFFDERETRAKRSKIMSRSGLIDKVSLFLSASSNPLVCRLRDARQVNAIMGELDSVGQVKDLVGTWSSVLPVTQTQTQEPISLETTPYMACGQIIGRDGDRDKILSMFLGFTETLNVLPIVGMGGIGKTTLAQFLYNNTSVQRNFDVMIWVCVGQVFDLRKVVWEILAFVTDDNPVHCGISQTALALLEKRLLPLVCHKKCLIVLDNVWDDENLSLHWQQLRRLLEFSGGRRTVIITTRSQAVARTMGTVDPYVLEGLKPEDSWLLFERVALTQRSEPGLKLIGQEIARMCRDVPLVINIIGNLLRERPTVEYWTSLRDDLARRSCCDLASSVGRILKLSVDRLQPSGLKLCFALWSLFPKEHEIRKTQLLYLWRALGYVHARRNQSAADAAQEYFLRLKDRGLLLQIGESQYYCRVKMHDVIHDLAISLGNPKYKMVESDDHEFEEETQHVSFCRKVLFPLEEFPSPSLFEIKDQLHSLCVFYCQINIILKRVSDFKHLRVFIMRHAGLEKLPATIGKLIQLRYLDLTGNSFKELPNSITKLVNLLYLDLSYCEQLQELPAELSKLVDLETLGLTGCRMLQELPRGISKLEKLRHLYLYGCDSLKHMPRGLGKLTDLQTLYLFVVRGQGGSDNEMGGLAELSPLNNLEGKLTIVVDGCGWSASEARAANLLAKQKLTALDITFKEGSKGEHEETMEGLQPHPNLECLGILDYKGERLPSWIDGTAYLANLEGFWIDGWKGRSIIGSLGRLPHLRFLDISNCENMEWIERTNSGSSSSNKTDTDAHKATTTTSAPSTPPFFPALEELCLENLPKLKGWGRIGGSTSSTSKQGHLLLPTPPLPPTAFPRLKSLDLSKVGIEVVPEEFRGLAELESLSIRNCEEVKEMPEWIDTLTSLKDLRIENCPKVKSIPKQIASLTNLKDLAIDACPRLEERCDKETGEDWPLIQHVPNIYIKGKNPRDQRSGQQP